MTKRFSVEYRVAALTFFSSLYFYSHVGTLYLQDRGLTLFQVNSLSALIIGTIFLAEVPTGLLADRIGRKWSIVTAMSLQVLGEVLYLFAHNYWAFALIAVIAGIGFAFSSGAIEALLYDSLTPTAQEDRPSGGRDTPTTDQTQSDAMKRAMGVKGFAYQLAFFLAPIVGSLLIPTYTLNRFLFVVFLTACSVGVALLIALTLQEPNRRSRQEEESSLQTLRKGITQLRFDRRLQWLLAITMLTSTFSMILVSLYQPFFAQAGISAFRMGWAFAIGAMVAGLGERYVYKLEQWLGPRLGLWTVTILPGFAYLAWSQVQGATLIFLLFVLTYGTTSLKNPLLSAYQNALIAPSQRATILSLINLCTSFYVALLSLVVGWLADINIRYGFMLIGSIIVVSTLILRVDRVGQSANVTAESQSHLE